MLILLWLIIPSQLELLGVDCSVRSTLTSKCLKCSIDGVVSKSSLPNKFLYCVDGHFAATWFMSHRNTLHIKKLRII